MPTHLQTPRKAERPVLWIINPDLLTSSIVEEEGIALEAANLQAVQRIERWLKASIEVYQTIGVETVLSSDKYRALVEVAHDRGFEVRMIYVLLNSVELNIERVRLRVSEGGHDVPEGKIRARRARSFEQLAWFLDKVDELFVFDNSTREPDLLIIKRRGWAPLWPKKLPSDLRDILIAHGISLGERAL